MVDEIRVLKIPTAEGKKGEKEHYDIVLLGLGRMAWSGGMVNSAPFCLFKPSSDFAFTSKETSSQYEYTKEL